MRSLHCTRGDYMNSSRQRPNWVDEEPLIQDVLNRFLDQLDRNVKTQFRVNNKSAPELFDHQEDDPQYLWHLLKTLDNEYHVLTISKQRGKTGHDSYDNAQLSFNQDKETLIRDWLNRPAFDPYTLTWNETFAKVSHVFEDGGEALRIPLRSQGKSASEVLQGFANVAKEINTTQTLRNISAKCFWGDSKFLDGKHNLICQLFPQASHNILPRPVLMNIALCDDIEKVIFVENQDSFLMLKHIAEKEHRFIKTAFVYSSGFKGTSSNIRKKGEVLFSTLGLTSASAMNEFEQWWFGQSHHPISAHFWGDMDYAGMSILKALRKSFTDVTAWQPGFELMRNFHKQGHGHTIRDSKKMQQLDPGTTGCVYADDILLPIIRSSQRFLDQEIIASCDLALN